MNTDEKHFSDAIYSKYGCLSLLAILFLLPLVGWWLWHPGGFLNPHDWISRHYQHDGKTEETPLYLEFRDELIQPPKTECWDIDFCARHNEVKVTTKCKTETK